MNKNIIINAIDNVIQLYSWLHQIDTSLYKFGLVGTIFEGPLDEHLNKYIQLGIDLIIDSINENDDYEITGEDEDYFTENFFDVIYHIAAEGSFNFVFIDEEKGCEEMRQLITAEDIYNLFTDKAFILSVIIDKEELN